MNNTKKLNLDQIDTFVIDFDGVMTDNKVYIDCGGNEFVSCNRADGLAFDILKKLSKDVFFLSSEKKSLVAARAKKLGIECYYGIENKDKELLKIINQKKYNPKKVFYIGNDINDYGCFNLVGFSACPRDSHPEIMKKASFVLNKNGGEGVFREVLEEIFLIDFVKVLYQ